MNYKSLEDDIMRWASAHDMVQALVVIGSRARKDHQADSWSDLDLILTVAGNLCAVQQGGQQACDYDLDYSIG